MKSIKKHSLKKANDKYKIALFHPWIKSKGGAEKTVLELLKKSKHDFEIYTWVYDEENTFEEFKKYKINIIAPRFLKRFARSHILRGLFFPLSLFKKIPLEKYDKFLISTSGLAEFITFRNYKRGETYAYVYTPLREASKNVINWNLKNRYNQTFFKKFIYLSAVKIYRIFEKSAWKRLGKIAFISELSKGRAIERDLIKNKMVSIIYPPVEFSRFENLKKVKETKSLVYYSRLNPPKRQDILLEAWRGFVKKNSEYKLFVVGNADNKKYLKKLKNLQAQTKNVEIKINVSNKELDKILSSSMAGLFLGYEEDFGIVPFEILAAGKHLLAVDEGGYVDLIKNHPKFHRVKEKHDSKKMVKELEKALNNFAKIKDKKIKSKKIRLNDFVKDINNFIEN